MKHYTYSFSTKKSTKEIFELLLNVKKCGMEFKRKTLRAIIKNG